VKTAILLSGHLRTFRQTFPSLKRFLLKRFPFDIFIATYDIEDNNHPTWWRKKTRDSKVKRTSIDEIQRIYNPRDIIIKKSEIPIKCAHDVFTKYPTKSLEYSISIVLEAYRLASKYQKYDRFISIRPDLELFTEFRKEEIENQNVTYFPRQDYFTLRGGICDTWVITNSFYMSFLDDYKQKVLPELFNSKRHMPHHELLLSEHLKKKKINIALSSVKWGLRRTKGIVQMWEQRMPFYENGNTASFIIKRALNYLYSKTIIMEDRKKLIILKIGKEGQFGKKESRPKKHSYKYSTPNRVRHLLPRIRAGKTFVEIYFLKQNANYHENKKKTQDR
jgi:hypothetical protein